LCLLIAGNLRTLKHLRKRFAGIVADEAAIKAREPPPEKLPGKGGKGNILLVNRIDRIRGQRISSNKRWQHQRDEEMTAQEAIRAYGARG
jgi:hypothetical protein